MEPFTRWFSLLSLLLAATDALPSPAAPHHSRSVAGISRRVGGNVALRLMAIGDDVTLGPGGGTNSYRAELQDLLSADGNPVEYAGSVQAGTMTENDVEAYAGLTAAELLAKVQTAVPEYKPNIVLINAGASDCAGGASGSDSPPNVKDTMLELLQFTWKNSIKVSAVLSTVPLPPTTGGDDEAAAVACIEAINEQYRSLVEEQQAISKKVVLVDLAAGLKGAQVTGGPGGLPTDEGYKAMAALWFDGLVDASSRGWVEKPEEVVDSPSKNKTADNDDDDRGEPPADEEEQQQDGDVTEGPASDGGEDVSTGDGKTDDGGQEESGDSADSSSGNDTGSHGLRTGTPFLTLGFAAGIAAVMVS